MGGELSQERMNSVAHDWYRTSLQHPCVLPDVGIDDSLLKFSGVDSNTALQSYSEELALGAPNYAAAAATAFGSATTVPNAVGLGAVVIAMILEVAVKRQTSPGGDSYAGFFHRVFDGGNAPSVRGAMAEYANRHAALTRDAGRLLPELRKYQEQLRGRLAALYGEQACCMTTRGVKIWANGASFHVQMLIHEARLRSQAGRAAWGYVAAINAVIDAYQRDLDLLLTRYAEYKVRTTKIRSDHSCSGSYLAAACTQVSCAITNTELNCAIKHYTRTDPCGWSGMVEAYVGRMLADYPPVTTLKSHFVDVKNNLVVLISQRHGFRVPRAA